MWLCMYFSFSYGEIWCLIWNKQLAVRCWKCRWMQQCLAVLSCARNSRRHLDFPELAFSWQRTRWHEKHREMQSEVPGVSCSSASWPSCAWMDQQRQSQYLSFADLGKCWPAVGCGSKSSGPQMYWLKCCEEHKMKCYNNPWIFFTAPNSFSEGHSWIWIPMTRACKKELSKASEGFLLMCTVG